MIVDVFRACTFACTALDRGASRLIEVDTLESASGLKIRNPCWVLAGEREGRPPAGFDTGNSPSRLSGMRLDGRTVIHTTSAGSLGAVLASRSSASGVCLSCFANASATARFVLGSGSATVSIVCMGDSGTSPAVEDEAFADCLEDLLCGRVPDYEALEGRITASGAADRFLRSGDFWTPPGDAGLCLSRDGTRTVPVLTGSCEGFPVFAALAT